MSTSFPAALRHGSGPPAASLGDSGDFYIDTTARAAYGPKTAGAWGAPGSLQGIRVGSGTPGAGTGVDGDYYLDISAGAYYGPKAGGAWPGTPAATFASSASVLLKASNLSDLASAAAARTNLGLGSAATQASGSFDAAGAAAAAQAASVPSTTVGQAGGVAGLLDANGLLPAAQLPPGALVGAAAPVTASTDAYATRILNDLKLFTNWLTANGVSGCIGEVGWPNDQPTSNALWLALASAWFAAADAAQLWVLAFTASEVQPDWRINLYASPPSTTLQPLGQVQRSARELEAHPTVQGVLRGVHMLGGEQGFDQTDATSAASNVREASGWAFGQAGGGATFAAAQPGAANTHPSQNGYGYWGGGKFAKVWNYGSLAGYRYLAGRGVKVVRLPFRWERLQRTWSGALDATELARLDQAVAWIGQCGMQVVLDMHNFGQYYLDDGSQGVGTSIGGATATNARFADLWSKLAAHYAANAAVLGYCPCNEPNLATNWASAGGPAQAAVVAIRAAGSTQTILVCGPGFASVVGGWLGVTPWITDTGNNFRYEAHHYWNLANDGSYRNSYATELASLTPGAGTVVVNDAFTRADSATTMGSSPQGQAWSPTNSGAGVVAGISGNQAYFASGVTGVPGSGIVATLDSGLSDGIMVGCDFPVFPNNAGLLVRSPGTSGSTDDDGILIVKSGTALQTYAVVNDGFTRLDGTSGNNVTPVNGDRIEAILNGSTITVRRNGSTLYSVTSTAGQSNTRHGIRSDGNDLTARFDNFKVTNP